jgi:hypothetical protein
VGLERFYTDSKAIMNPLPSFNRQSQKQRRRRHRSLSHNQKGGKNRARARTQTGNTSDRPDTARLYSTLPKFQQAILPPTNKATRFSKGDRQHWRVPPLQRCNA